MRIHLRHPLAHMPHAEQGIYAAALLALVLIAGFGALQFSTRDAGWNQRLVPSQAQSADGAVGWQEFSVAERAPEILGALSIPELQFQHTQQLPVAKIDGELFKGRLPATLWVKLDQPGNAYLIAETDAGSFVKVLQDASPGFASPCKLSPYEFGTLQGEPIYFDRDELTVKTLWIVQDCSAETGRIPGWVRVPEREVSIARSMGK